MACLLRLARGLTAATALWAAVASAAAADEKAAPDGRALAAACTSCHGVDGHGGQQIPALAGRPEAELLSLMEKLRAPAEGATIMPRILRAYDDNELKALAAWFAEVKP